MQPIILLFLLFFSISINAQELFVFYEPASTLSSRSINLSVTDHYTPFDRVYDRAGHRLATEVRFGVSKNITATVGASISNMHTFTTKEEAVYGELKYRFLSHDAVQQHFRLAAFLQGGYTKAPFHYDETNLLGDKSGVSMGMIATQLINRFALSAMVGHTQVLDASRTNEVVYIPRRIYQAMNYSLSSSYLLLPKCYKNYKQVNLNLYGELLAQRALDHKSFYIDAAPAMQLIFFSNTRVNIGYHFQIAGNAERMSNVGWLFSLERSFLEVWK